MAREKNECAKTRPVTDPYEVWVSRDGSWEWHVLKKYQSPSNEAKNPYAVWFCNVKTPIVPDGEMGDVYVSEIKSNARQREYVCGSTIVTDPSLFLQNK